jgi:hypothetical protein
VNQLLACIDEVQTSAWREGMIAGISECLHLCTQKGLRRHRLYRAIEELSAQQTPAPYRHYLRVYSRQPFVDGIALKAVSHWQWRTCAIELAELLTAAELLDCPGGRREEELRSVLLLADDEPSTAPYAAVLAGGLPTDPQPLFLDGHVDGLLRSTETLISCDYDAADFAAAMLRDLNNLWPNDYVTYRARAARRAAAEKNQDRETAEPPTAQAADRKTNILAYPDWCAAVRSLHDAQTAAPSQQRPLAILHELAGLLLLGPNDRIPTFAWSLSQELAEELAR